VQHQTHASKMSRTEAARKGGQAVSTNRQHMAEIGRKGGQSVSRDREHMARIGEKGGTSRRTRSSHN
jgi:general stress protein YciG